MPAKRSTGGVVHPGAVTTVEVTPESPGEWEEPEVSFTPVSSSTELVLWAGEGRRPLGLERG